MNRGPELEELVLRHGCDENNEFLFCTVAAATDKPPRLGRILSIHKNLKISQRCPGMTESLADYWRARGFEYSDADAKAICNVEVVIKGHKLSYPADKVWRHRAYDLNNEALVERHGYPFENRTIIPRKAFTCVKGWQLISADYSQFELRFLAHYCNDEAMCASLRSGEDIMRNVAARWKDKPPGEVTSDERN